MSLPFSRSPNISNISMTDDRKLFEILHVRRRVIIESVPLYVL